MPLTAWQVCRAAQSDLSGRTAESGARWNPPGRRVVYLSDHPALAVLEARAHLDLPYEKMEHDHRLIRVALPEDVEDLHDLPDDPVAFGDAWLREGRTAVLRVPSIIVREARNLLLNPAHPRAVAARIEASTPFRFDRRLWHGA